MRDNRCPNCENDINTAVTAAIVAAVQGGHPVETVTCPHCAAELNLSVSVNATLSRADEPVAF